MKKNDIETAIFLSGVGQLKDVELGFFNGERYEILKYDEVFELLSMSGNITKQKEGYIIHIHVVLGREDGSTIGGHLMRGIVQSTNEIVLMISNLKIERRLEENNLKGWYF